MTEDIESLAPWEPTELEREIRTWIDLITGPPPDVTEEERQRNEAFLTYVRAEVRRLVPAAVPEGTAPIGPDPGPPSPAPREPPVTVRQVLDALDRLALRCLAGAMTDPFELATALRVLDGATGLRHARGIERRTIVDIGPTTWQVAEEVFDTVRYQLLAEPAPTWATELAASLAQTKDETTPGTTPPPAAPPVPPVTPEPNHADASAITYLNLTRGLELGHLEALIDDDVLIGGDVGVLDGLHTVAMLRLSTGITRDQEADLRRAAALPSDNR
jgi:hypothetical protein